MSGLELPHLPASKLCKQISEQNRLDERPSLIEEPSEPSDRLLSDDKCINQADQDKQSPEQSQKSEI